MKKGLILKSNDTAVSAEELKLINGYTRRDLGEDEVYVFSVVLCDNDIDRDFERFTVESLFELEKLFVGKTGIFDHNPSATKQTARIFSCKVEAVDGEKTATGDDYFRLVAKAYIPKSESNKDVIMSIDSGIIKEVSVGCAVKSTVCSICSNEMNSGSCSHMKGETYSGKLCFGELTSVYDAYEFSFVAIPAQKNAGVIKNFLNDTKEAKTMKDILSQINNGGEVNLKVHQSKNLKEYINTLKTLAEDGRLYKEELKKSVLSMMSVSNPQLSVDTLKGIMDKLSLSELLSLRDSYEKKNAFDTGISPQLYSKKTGSEKSKAEKNNQFTI